MSAESIKGVFTRGSLGEGVTCELELSGAEQGRATWRAIVKSEGDRIEVVGADSIEALLEVLTTEFTARTHDENASLTFQHFNVFSAWCMSVANTAEHFQMPVAVAYQ